MRGKEPPSQLHNTCGPASQAERRVRPYAAAAVRGPAAARPAAIVDHHHRIAVSARTAPPGCRRAAARRAGDV